MYCPSAERGVAYSWVAIVRARDPKQPAVSGANGALLGERAVTRECERALFGRSTRPLNALDPSRPRGASR